MTAGYERTRAYRAEHPERYEGQRRRNAARQRALVRLARARADEFQTLYAEELAVAGLRARVMTHHGGTDDEGGTQ